MKHGLKSVMSLSLLLCFRLLTVVGPADAQVVYETNFDSLTTGQTQPFPGASGQDGWYRHITFGSNYGEIQSAVSKSGNALHEFSATANATGQQSADTRPLTLTALNTIHTFTLSYDFLAHSSDLSTVNPFQAFILVNSPGSGEALGVDIGGGNGTVKSSSGVRIGLGTFNGVNNNERINLTIGQNLAWDTWHHVSVIGDFQANRYVSLTVNGITELLTSYSLPDSFPGGVPTRPTAYDALDTGVIAHNTTFSGNATDDHIYWDNILLTSTAATTPEPGTLALCLSGTCVGTILFRRRRSRSTRQIELSH